YRPQLALELTDARGATIQRFDPRPAGRIPVDDAYVAAVRQGIRAGMEIAGTSPHGIKYTGTSYDSNIREVAIAGKTSTADEGTPGADGKLKTHGWFSFWAPYDQPKLAGAVFVKEGRGAQEAAKVGRDVVKAYFGIV